MNKKKLWIAGLISLITLTLNFQLVFAHESITVGDYTVEIGWLSEPPIVGQQNAIVVNVSTTSDEQPVEDVSALTVTVSYGGQDKTLTLQPLGEDTPGQFIAPILPTVPGQYTVKLGGTLGETAVDTQVDPEEVQSADTLAFPSGASAESAEQSANAGMMNWLIYLSLLIGLIALVLGVMSLRKPR
jgi:LysM repeat protein